MKTEHELHECTNDTNENKIIYSNLSYRIMEAIFEVHNILGPGYSEGIYEEAVAKEFRNREIKHERQKLIEVYYKDEKIGKYKLDIIVEGKVILELKAVTEINEVFVSQLISYLKATGLKLGILVNFGQRRIEYRRVAN